MILFYCEKCEKQMWQEADWDNLKHYTLEQTKRMLICSDCILAYAKGQDE